MKPMKLVAGLAVTLLLAMGAISAYAMIDEAGVKAPVSSTEDASRKCPPFC